MTNAQSDASETPQPEDWAGEMGTRWLAGIDQFESMIAPIGDALLARASFKTGEHVLDLGCGGGATSLTIAELVGPGGSVTGIDISPDLIAKARERAEAADTRNATFECGDAASYKPEAAFDRMVSRFGSMFFPHPVEAFSNLHDCLKQGGRLDLAVWGPPRDNPLDDGNDGRTATSHRRAAGRASRSRPVRLRGHGLLKNRPGERGVRRYRHHRLPWSATDWWGGCLAGCRG